LIPHFASVPEALSFHSQTHPADPWLFSVDGWHWRWRSFRAVDFWVRAWSASLADLSPGSEVWYPSHVGPAAVVADLAIQAAGLVAVPSPEAPLDAACFVPSSDDPHRRWTLRQPGLEDVPLDIPDARASSLGTAVLNDDRAHLGGAVTSGPSSRRRWTAGELKTLAFGIPAPAPKGVVVTSISADHALGRAVLSWATVHGASLVLEPDPPALVSTALWARPTLFVGTPEEIALLEAGIRKGDRRLRSRLRRTFSRRSTPSAERLRHLVVRGETLGPDRLEFWRERGVGVITEPEVLAPGPVV
jgi:hypothetical protein